MMPVRSAWAHVETDKDHKIFFIEDISHLTLGCSITNDAENVLQHFHDAAGPSWRVVYKDSEGEWWEIVQLITQMGETIRFDRWHGLEWDILKR